MQIKNFIKPFIKIFTVIAVIECIYLFLTPIAIEKVLCTNYIKNIVSKNTNAQIKYSKPKIKTHIIPSVSIEFNSFEIDDKNTASTFLITQNPKIKILLLPLLLKRVNIKSFNADKIYINVEKNEDGSFNFEKLFPKKDKKLFKLKYNNINFNVVSLSVHEHDKKLDKINLLNAEPLKIKGNKKKNIIFIKTKGIVFSNNKSEFDIDLKAKYPISFKDFNKDDLEGSCFIYNLDLKQFLPYLKNQNIKKLEGFIDYIQLSSSKKEEQNNLVLNTKFNNVIFDKEGWKNYIIASGENNINSAISLKDNIINIKSFSYNADKINIKANGTIELDKKPKLDIQTEVIDSRAENIASILPPNLVPQYMTIEKVKTYGVYGDLNAKVNIKGIVPQPDITGYVIAENVKVLDKSIHNLHKGTVKINFDKRILNMDILVNLFDNQKANIKGYVYMFRDGINNVTIKTTDNIDFPLAQKIVVPVSKVFNFQLGPIPEMNITSGKGIIDVNVQGSIDYVNLNGYSSFDKAQLTYNGLFGEVKNGKGRLDFKEDTVYFKSERAFVKNNPLSIDGKVRINKDLDFNISSSKAQAEDLLEIINKSDLLKDVKAGLKIITKASGLTKLTVNITAKIVPVPFGQPPLPPEEAFEDMKVKGSLYLFSDDCFIEGFYTPISKIKGIVDFTETLVTINNLSAISGTSPIEISGKIINDLDTKIPFVDILVTSDSVNLKDTIKFLTKSYLYPKNYPDLSPLYNIASKHDLYFKYTAKAIDFVTNKAYAVMNFIPDNTQNPIKAKSGKIIMENANVKVENINADLFDSFLKINGEIKRVDTLNPIYNLDINTNKFNLANLDNAQEITILPEQIKNILKQFHNYQGFADVNLKITKNIFSGKAELIKPQMEHCNSKTPLQFDDIDILFDNNKLILNNLSAKADDMPVYGNFKISNLNKEPQIKGYLTSKITNNFIKNYLPKDYAQKIILEGDINFSADISGSINDINIKPKLTFYPDADITIDGSGLGEVTDKREFIGNIYLKDKKINIKKLDYVKYIATQNNTYYPLIFASLNGILNINKDNIIEPEEIYLKTNKNISAKVLNILLKSPVFQQGTLNCDLKYTFDKLTKTAKLKGTMDCRNLDIPLFDTIIKNIKLKTTSDDININIFGFINESKITINSILANNLYEKPKVHALKIYADQIDNDKLLRSFSKAHNAMTNNNKIKNTDLSALSIEKGYLEIKKIIIKSLEAENLTSDFSVDKDGIFKADDIKVQVGEGDIQGSILYNLTNSKFQGDFELKNVDANYVAETLFDGKNQIYGNASGKVILSSQGLTDKEIIQNLSGLVFFDISDGRMPKLGSLEYLLRASNIIKSGVTGFTLNSILELLNLVKTGYFSNISGSCKIDNGIANNIEIFSKGENLSLYIHGSYDIANTNADMEILGKLSRRISTIFGKIGNTSLNTFFKLIPGISMLDFGRKDFIEDVEKIPSFTNGDYESRIFQAIINGDINSSGYVQSFKWVKQKPQ